jgi:hypothetical protein
MTIRYLLAENLRRIREWSELFATGETDRSRAAGNVGDA